VEEGCKGKGVKFVHKPGFKGKRGGNRQNQEERRSGSGVLGERQYRGGGKGNDLEEIEQISTSGRSITEGVGSRL